MSSAHAMGSKYQCPCAFSASHACLLCCRSWGQSSFGVIGGTWQSSLGVVVIGGMWQSLPGEEAVVLADLFVQAAVLFNPLDAPTVGITPFPGLISARLRKVSPIISKDPAPVPFSY